MADGRTGSGGARQFLVSVARWFDAYAAPGEIEAGGEKRVDWFRVVPFLALHLACLAVAMVGWSATAVWTAVALYVVRMFAVTAFYHRYFSHNAFRAGRAAQFVFAVLGNSAVQRGPLWWAAHHRHHHRYSDTDEDVHSPVRHGFYWAHVGWILSTRNFRTRTELIGDFAAYPELRFLDRFDALVPLLLALGLYGAGAWLGAHRPDLGTDGPQMLVWGFFVSTVVLFHATSTINSLDHMVGSKRYRTGDESRNNALLAVLTLGEGWHNNHHRYAVAARQGFYRWEVDVSYMLLVVLSWLGVVRDLRPVPAEVLAEGRRGTPPAGA